MAEVATRGVAEAAVTRRGDGDGNDDGGDGGARGGGGDGASCSVEALERERERGEVPLHPRWIRPWI
uniref:Uncharacterized protein K0007B01.41 n=1 Tax=Oryza sativa subsp. indica TaxID=39946 RepID=C8TET7_ORYSI|nr:hypothetical protein [Oryza sativa Indica Group]BAI39718.1 hypothetical protein [Oryza sativa Indica Group]